MGTNCAPLLTDIFLYSSEAEVVQKLIQRKPQIVTNLLQFKVFYLILTPLASWQLHWCWICYHQLYVFLPLLLAFGVHLIRKSTFCVEERTKHFSKQGKLLTKKLMLQGYNESHLKSSFRKFYGRHNDLVYTGLYAEWFVSYNLLDCHFHTSLNDG